MAQKLKTDWVLFSTIVVMVFFGVVMLYSASSVMAQLKYGSSWHFFYRQDRFGASTGASFTRRPPCLQERPWIV